MGWQIMGTEHLRPKNSSGVKPNVTPSDARIRRIARDEMRKMLDEMAEEALQHLKEL